MYPSSDVRDSLTNALAGQDVLVSVMDRQPLLDGVAVRASVKRFIPSELGSNTLDEKIHGLLDFEYKIAVRDVLKKQAASGRMC